MAAHDFSIETIGPCRFDSPIHLSRVMDDFMANYVSDTERVIYDIEVDGPQVQKTLGPGDLLEKAGPRERIFFNPISDLRAAIVTCGGLCPGLNDVIRAIIMCLWYEYGVRTIYGIKYGYRGLYAPDLSPALTLTPDLVADIHREGGTILGSSRGGGARTAEMVTTLQNRKVNLLFTIGGDGTQKGAALIADEAKRRGMELAVVGIPKTIDNDFCFVEKSFGFETAVSYAVEAVASAHVEAHDALDGIGIVKVMGRESGFIAVHTALAMNDVNFLLVPEVPFDLDGPNGLLAHLERRLDKRGHAVILTAEGAGQELMHTAAGNDASGNRKLADIGVYLKERIAAFFAEKKREVNIKYIDPSYMIRSAPATPNDSIYCQRLGANAVHAAMCGRTKLLIGRLHNRFVHIPLALAVSKRNKVDPESALWRDALEATGQPPLMRS